MVVEVDYYQATPGYRVYLIPCGDHREEFAVELPDGSSALGLRDINAPVAEHLVRLLPLICQSFQDGKRRRIYLQNGAGIAFAPKQPEPGPFPKGDNFGRD